MTTVIMFVLFRSYETLLTITTVLDVVIVITSYHGDDATEQGIEIGLTICL